MAKATIAEPLSVPSSRRGVFSFDSLLSENWNGAPKEAALMKFYTWHKQTNKQVNKQPTTHTVSWAWKKRGASRRKDGWWRMEKNTTSKQAKKMWEKRLNENYFKLFRRRNRRSEGERLRTEECKPKMAATGRSGTGLPFAWRIQENCRRPATTWREPQKGARARAKRIGTRMDRTLVNPFLVC